MFSDSLPLLILALLVLLLLVVVAAELLCRLWARNRRFAVYRPNERWSIRPAKGLSDLLPEQSEVLCNEDGDRGSPVPAAAGDRGPLRVLMCGGSAGECLFLSNADTLAGQLETKLAEAVPAGAHVGSICRSGYNTKAVLRTLEATFPRNPKVDVIVAIMGAGDVFAWVHWDGAASSVATPADPRLFRVYPKSDFGWHPKRMALLEAVRSFDASVLRRWTKRTAVGRKQASLLPARHKMQPELGLADLPDPAPLWKSLDEGCRELIEFGRKHGAEVVVVPQIWLSTEGQPEARKLYWQGVIEGGPRTGQAVSHDAIFHLMGEANRILEKATREAGGHLLPLGESFQPVVGELYDELHFTASGCEKAAGIMAGYITRHCGIARGR